MAVDFPITPSLDNFNRADVGPPPSANWGIIVSTAAEFQVVSNKAKIPVGGSGSDAWLPTGNIKNGEVWGVQGALASAGSLSLYNRMSPLNSPTYFGYSLRCISGALQYRRFDGDSSTFVQLATDATSPAVGDIFGIRIVNNNHTIFRIPIGTGIPEVVFTAVDSTYPSGYIGMAVGTDTVASWDEIGGGEVAGPNPIVIPRIVSSGGRW